MNEVKNIYTIVYACDNNFVPLLAASIKSLELNSPGSTKEVYIIDDGIKRHNKQKLLDSIQCEELILKFIPARDAIPRDGKIPYFNNSALPLTAFFRIFIETFLPADTERVLYVDSDTIILQDIAQLWEIDISNSIIAAVPDLNIKTFDCPWGGIRNYKELNYPGDTIYFNSGLILFNFKKWVEFYALDKTLSIARQHKKHILYGDQYCLNLALVDNWLALDPRWNHLVDNPAYEPGNHPEPYLLHFTDTKPIYTNYVYNQEYKKVFFSYLNKTRWKDMQPIGSFRRKFRRLTRVFTKILN